MMTKMTWKLFQWSELPIHCQHGPMADSFSTYPVIVGWVGRDIYSLADRFLLPSPGAPLVHIVTLPTALIPNPWSRSGCRVPLVAALSLGHVGLGTVDRLDVLSQGTGVGVALGTSSDLACIWFLWLRKEQSHRICHPGIWHEWEEVHAHQIIEQEGVYRRWEHL